MTGGFLALALLCPSAEPTGLAKGDELTFAGTVEEAVERPGNRFRRCAEARNPRARARKDRSLGRRRRAHAAAPDRRRGGGGGRNDHRRRAGEGRPAGRAARPRSRSRRRHRAPPAAGRPAAAHVRRQNARAHAPADPARHLQPVRVRHVPAASRRDRPPTSRGPSRPPTRTAPRRRGRRREPNSSPGSAARCS